MNENIALREKTCFISGHRDTPRERYPEVQRKLEATILELMGKGVQYFCCSGAIGFDTIAALTVLRLKRHHPQLHLILILPCKNHDFSWQGEDKTLHEKIKAHADKVIYTAERYFSGCMNKRNRLMAENSAWAICYLTRATGGTAYTITYAKSMGVQVINLAEE